MIRDRVGRPVNGKASPHIDWGDRKRLLASTWIWTRVTDGEPHFAPLLRPDPTGPKRASDLSNYIHSRWPFIARGHGHYADLRPCLDAHADTLAQQIDDREARRDQPGAVEDCDYDRGAGVASRG